MVSERVIVLPAFSRWTAGTDIRHPLMSSFARAAKFTRAIAICGDKLLPIAL
jgi:metallophosphoesterase superfamily enzyme